MCGVFKFFIILFFNTRCPTSVCVLGEEKEKGSGELLTGTHGTLAATRMVTRLRNPDSKLSQQKSQQVAAVHHESYRLCKEGKDVSVCGCPLHILCS